MRKHRQSRIVMPLSAKKQSKRSAYTKKTVQTKTRLVLLLGIFFVCIFGIVGILLYHPFFRVSQIKVSGLERINQEAFLSAAEGIMDYNVFFILPKSSFLMVDKTELEVILSEKFPIAEITIEKTFPDLLNVSVKEEISSVIYDDTRTYSFIGLDGTVVETIRSVGDDEWFSVGVVGDLSTPTSTTAEAVEKKEHRIDAIKIHKEMGKYPIIYDEFAQHSQEGGRAGRVVVISPEHVANMIRWFKKLPSDVGLSVAYFRLDKSRRNVEIVTNEGLVVLVWLGSEFERQLESLRLSQEHGFTEDVSYVDIRHQGRVFLH